MTTSLGRGHDVRFNMTPPEMNLQLQQCKGEIVVYGCYEVAKGPGHVTWWVGKLTEVDGEFFVELGPNYTLAGSGCEEHPRQEQFKIPAAGYLYTFIWPAADFVTAKMAAESQRQRRAFAAVAAPVQASAFKSALGLQPPAASLNFRLGAANGTRAATAAAQPAGAAARDASPPPRAPVGAGGAPGGGGAALFRNALQQALDEEEDADDDNDDGGGDFGGILNRTVALDPEAWRTHIASTADVISLMQFLRQEFAISEGKQNKKDAAVAREHLDICQCLAASLPQAPASIVPHLVRAAQLSLTRLYSMALLRDGHASEFVNELQLAVAGQNDPGWLANAHKLATTRTKARMAAPHQVGRGGGGGNNGGGGYHGGDSGRGGGGRGRGGRGSGKDPKKDPNL